MKEFLNKKGLILSFSLILLVVFVFGGMYSRFMSTQLESHIEDYEQEQIEKEAEEALREYRQSLIDTVPNGTQLEEFSSLEVDKVYLIPESSEEYTPELIEAYQVLNENDEAIAVVYVIETIGRSDGVRVAYSISLETDQLLDIVVISHNETTAVEDEYYNLLDETFFNQFTNKDFDVAELTVDTVAGATTSSLAFVAGLDYSRELYASDFDFEIPQQTIAFVFNSMVYNYNLTTIEDYELVADVTFDDGEKQAFVGLDSEFNFVEVLQGDDLNETEQLAFASQAEASGLISEVVEVVEYDETNQTITLRVFGFNRDGFTLTVELNSSGTSVENIAIDTTNENYDAEYNDGYNGGPAPVVEDDYINQFNLDGTIISIDSYAGATRTSEAMAAALEWAKNFGASSGVVDVTVDDFDYNYDLSTVVDYPFIANITFNSDQQATILVDATFNYGGLVSGVEPTNEVISALSDPLEAANTFNKPIDVSAYDSSNHTIEMITIGFNRNNFITLLVQLNNEETNVVSVSIISTNENYDDEYNSGYSGAPVPVVEDDYINQYNLDGSILSIDSHAGATRTSEAMTAAFEWLNTFMNGGN